ncbi:type VI secretion system lipoprotein TssJ [Chimaeribacter arupi]|uniref:type VI secretion system lipoprotein TssJ n=1 Tax=Chimaeribacter arupi TaxID=2060066 RepID=UPI0029463334|nr:type VI secretion system lipoprotein TssJ [Chimaeribacter arupi]MDV5140756.1 type VI secretion system lipoprotein TssJ [Chimaeribacter arupi]
MLHIASINRFSLLLLPVLLAGCGLTQSLTEETASAANAIFYQQVNTLRLDFTAREALNTDARESGSLSEPLMIRVYQLRDRKAFDKTVYEQLVSGGEGALGETLLASREVIVKPGGDANLTMPMDEQAQYVAVVGLFRHPDREKNHWKQVLTRDDLDPDEPRIIVPGSNSLTLLPEKN